MTLTLKKRIRMTKNKYIILLVFLLSQLTVLSQDNLIKADATRISNRVKELSQFGALPDGGVNRVAFSEADIAGRNFVMALFKQAGLEVTIDAAGNIIGRREGSDPDLAPICFGSHIDSVPSGGNYDGVAGVLSGLECIELLNENKIVSRHPLELIVFTDEEGGLIGSMSMNGTISDKDLDRISNSGKVIRQGIRDIGGEPDIIKEVVREKGDIAAFLELHIEQGAILYNEGLELGIVEGIVGIETWAVTIEGKANHAGTTPMNLRKDALVGASKLIIAVNNIVSSIPGRQVGTVGKIAVEPGASNVVPGKVLLTIELRDLSNDKIHEIFDTIVKEIKVIEEESGVRISYVKDHTNISALMDDRIKSLLEESAIELGLKYKMMPSGAGHDAQAMAKIAPTGMLFVPSRDGISHSPLEYSSTDDIAAGASVMYHTILKLDSKLK